MLPLTLAVSIHHIYSDYISCDYEQRMPYLFKKFVYLKYKIYICAQIINTSNMSTKRDIKLTDTTKEKMFKYQLLKDIMSYIGWILFFGVMFLLTYIGSR